MKQAVTAILRIFPYRRHPTGNPEKNAGKMPAVLKNQDRGVGRPGLVVRHATAAFLLTCLCAATQAQTVTLTSEQITFGPDHHHFFGYFGHAGNMPWNESGRYIVALRTTFDDRWPEADDAADIILLDAHNDYEVEVIERSLAWNFQQGTMLNWRVEEPETQILFNDRDPDTDKVFCVLYDVEKRERVREYRFDDTPIGCSGLAQRGQYFFGLNYGRLDELRRVTGYPGAYDWTARVLHPEDDGVWRVDIETGEKKLLVSFKQLADVLRPIRPDVDGRALFINHTLGDRTNDFVYFIARADFGNRRERINHAFTIRTDGTDLVQHPLFIGGHPEWGPETYAIGRHEEDQIYYDIVSKEIVGKLGTPEIFPDPEGDIALSPDGKWFVNGFRYSAKGQNMYAVYRIEDGAWAHSEGFNVKGWTRGDLRIDPSPCWNRPADTLLLGALDEHRTRQLFLIHVEVEE